MGGVQANNAANIFQVTKQYFAATLSMQNAHVIYGTNGASAYVLKYIVKLDQVNRVRMWADYPTGTVLRAHKTFTYSIKITGSKINEEWAFEKSRAYTDINGHITAFTKIQQQGLDYSAVMTNLRFERIEIKPPEQRTVVYVKLDSDRAVTRPNVNKDDTETTGYLSETARYLKENDDAFNFFDPQSKLTLSAGAHGITM